MLISPNIITKQSIRSWNIWAVCLRLQITTSTIKPTLIFLILNCPIKIISKRTNYQRKNNLFRLIRKMKAKSNLNSNRQNQHIFHRSQPYLTPTTSSMPLMKSTSQIKVSNHINTNPIPSNNNPHSHQQKTIHKYTNNAC